MKNINNIIHNTLKLFNFKKKTIDKEFLKKRKNFFSTPLNFFFINSFLIKKNISINIPTNQIFNGIKFLIDQQKMNGSFDEWYANENSFCATAYAGYYLSKIKKTNHFLDKKIDKSLKKIESFLEPKDNFKNLNQELAKFAFFANYQNKYKAAYKKKILKKTLEFENYEYGGIDLGYLSTNLMILSDLLNNKFDKTLYEIFKNQLTLFAQLSNNYKSFPNYIFSRSSRLILLSGFYFAYKYKLINKADFKNIYKNYLNVLNIFISRKDLKYLSFFYIPDFAIILNIKKNKIKLKKKKIKQIKNLSNYYISLKLKKNTSISVYLKNANVFSINQYINKYFFDNNINYQNYKFIPKVNQRFILGKKFIFMKNSYVKMGNIDKYFRYFKYVSTFNKIFKIGNIIKIIGRYMLINQQPLNNIASYKKIYIKNNKIKVREILISRYNRFKKNNQLSLDNKQYYFSPTSFILKKDIGNKKNEKIKSFNKLNSNIIIREYECL